MKMQRQYPVIKINPFHNFSIILLTNLTKPKIQKLQRQKKHNKSKPTAQAFAVSDNDAIPKLPRTYLRGRRRSGGVKNRRSGDGTDPPFFRRS